MVENIDNYLLQNVPEKDTLFCTEQMSDDEYKSCKENSPQRSEKRVSSMKVSPVKIYDTIELSASAKPNKKKKITKQKNIRKPTLNLKNSTPSSGLNTEPLVDDIFDMIDEKEAPENPSGVWCTYSGDFSF